MRRFKVILSFLLIIITLCSCGSTPTLSSFNPSDLVIHYIDVGQGDSILIQVNGKNMLVDSGSSQNKDKLFNYLKKINVHKFDYVIATHPHEDHIGNMASIIKKCTVKNFYAPKVTNNSKSFEKMIDALIDKDLKINVIKAEINSITLGNDVNISFFAPLSLDYGDDLNNYSAVFKITYGDTSFLFTGDCEQINEEELLKEGFDLNSDVLKVAHHGSTTSSSNDFIKAVSPDFAVISVGKKNDYHHPAEKTLATLTQNNAKILRTDKCGTIIFKSDGKNIFYCTEK